MNFIIGQFDHFFKIILILMIVDYITAILVAIYNQTISSSVGYKGIIKKVGILFFIILAQQIDNLNVTTDSNVRFVIIIFK